MSIPSPEAFRRYQENRNRKYAEDPACRERVRETNKRAHAIYGERRNAARRKRWAEDSEYRERKLSKLRGRDQRETQLKVHYGITMKDYNRMLEMQGGNCAICRKPSEKTLHVDHCHLSKIVRGLLCGKCNVGLGCYSDDPELLVKAARYLESHRVVD